MQCSSLIVLIFLFIHPVIFTETTTETVSTTTLSSIIGERNKSIPKLKTKIKDSTTTIKSQWFRKTTKNPFRKVKEPEENITDGILPRFITPCITPNDDNAYCIEIKSCPILFNQLNNSEAWEFLKRSRCGPINESPANPRICCGKYENYKELVKKTNQNVFPKKCGFQKVVLRNRIVGGKHAQIGEFPWMVRLIHKNANGYKNFGCSGFLITARVVLTAAHCFSTTLLHALGPIFEVELGEHNSQTEIDCDEKGECADPIQVIRVGKTIVHPKYDNTSRQYHHDLALVHLRKAAKYSNYVQPICLLDKPLKGMVEFWISGWGKTETENTSPIKMKLSLPLFDLGECTEKYTMVSINVTPNQICAGGRKNKDSCTGDSGGPLMVAMDGNHWFAAGVVSYGLGCGKQGWPGVYTNVTSYFDWIKQQIKAIQNISKTKNTKN